MSLFSTLFGSSSAGAARVDGTTARQLVADGAQLVDVRTPAEYASGHVEGAVNIPVQVIQGQVGQLDKSRGVVVYCRSGGRSARAGQILDSAGFKPVHDLGPMSAW